MQKWQRLERLSSYQLPEEHHPKDACRLVSVRTSTNTILWRNLFLRSNKRSSSPGPSKSKKTDQNPNRSQQTIHKRDLGNGRNQEQLDEDQGQDEEEVEELERFDRN
ncbi:BZ3500_MvSof-1268-A1-R1_Chr2-1g04321 [Microbotryum saponariae]|uniref:BZ3500_MvSof-1268-A1-R1_Chr2-1g04321 protein n=1 Tax=Microbotryum saponariae TaxID=289078 RepID=A0A2X0KIF7_9BASI|nr:BZ3500_MvSof-1268-A1-R1_Chr2-1g04321 [Microbotryum saponariae]SCZ91428.1 BZ3501_MvSof-1269-A2-R1_Chr2-1g03977 [Microbotryum saponariae]